MNHSLAPAGNAKCRADLLYAQLLNRCQPQTKGSVLLLGHVPASLAQQIVQLSGVTHVESLLMGGAEDLPEMQARTYAVVVVMDYFEQAYWGPWVLQQLLHSIKPGGILIATCAHPAGILHYIRRLKEMIFSSSQTVKQVLAAPHFYDSFSTLEKINKAVNKCGSITLYQTTFMLPPWNYASGGMWHFLTSWLEKKVFQACDRWGDWGSQALFVCQVPETTNGKLPLAFAQTSDELSLLYNTHFHDELRVRQEWVKRYNKWQTLIPTQYGDRMEPSGDVLVLSPHPDDELIGCGGMILKLREQGHSITILQLTDGGASAALQGVTEAIRRTERFQEARKVANGLNATLHCWPIEGSSLTCSHETISDLGNLLRANHFGYIFIPFVNDSHPDHVTTNHILARVLEEHSAFLAHETYIYSYEVWSLVPVNHLCIIDNQIVRKCDLLMHYRTGMKAVNYIYRCRLNNAHTARFLLDHDGYAEEFLKLGVEEYLHMIHVSKN